MTDGAQPDNNVANPEFIVSKKYKIFISYGRGDYVEKIIKSLIDKLEETGEYEVWFDRRDLTADEDFTKLIADAIVAADCMLLFVGSHAAKSDYCKREWQEALKNCVLIIPVLVGDYTFDQLRKSHSPRITARDGRSATDYLSYKESERDTFNDVLFTHIEKHRVEERKFVEPVWHRAEFNMLSYIERQDCTEKLLKYLGDPSNPDLPNQDNPTGRKINPPVLVTGNIGVGKTYLLKNFVNQCDVRRRDAVHYVHIGQDIESVDKVDVSAFEDGDKLAEGAIVLVLDNVAHQNPIRYFLDSRKRNPNLKLYIGSREKNVIDDYMDHVDEGYIVSVGNFEQTSIRSYLKRTFGLENQAERIVDKLYQITRGGHPSLVAMIVDYLRENDDSDIDQYIEMIDGGTLDMEKLPSLIPAQLKFGGIKENEQKLFYHLCALPNISISDDFAQRLGQALGITVVSDWKRRLSRLKLIKLDHEEEDKEKRSFSQGSASFSINAYVTEQAMAVVSDHADDKQIPSITDILTSYRKFWGEVIENIADNEHNPQEQYEGYSRHLLYFFMLVSQKEVDAELVGSALAMATKLRDIAVKKRFNVQHPASIAYRGVVLAERMLRSRALDTEYVGQPVDPNSEDGKLYAEWYGHLRRLSLSLGYMNHPETEEYLNKAIKAAKFLKDNQHNVSGAQLNLAAYCARTGKSQKAYEAITKAGGALEEMTEQQREGEFGFEQYYLRKLMLIVNHAGILSEFLYTIVYPTLHVDGLAAVFNRRGKYTESTEEYLEKLQKADNTEDQQTIPHSIRVLQQYQTYREKWLFPDLFALMPYLKRKKFVDSANVDVKELRVSLISRIEEYIEKSLKFADEVIQQFDKLGDVTEEERRGFGEEIEYQRQNLLAVRAQNFILMGQLQDARDVLDRLNILKDVDETRYRGIQSYLAVASKDFDMAYEIMEEHELWDVDKSMNFLDILTIMDDLEKMLAYYQREDAKERVKIIREKIENFIRRLEEMKKYALN